MNAHISAFLSVQILKSPLPRNIGKGDYYREEEYYLFSRFIAVITSVMRFAGSCS